MLMIVMMKIILGGNDVNDRAAGGNVSGSVDSDPVGRVVSSPVASATGQDVVSGGGGGGWALWSLRRVLALVCLLARLCLWSNPNL